jgi:hypothetical protein
MKGKLRMWGVRPIRSFCMTVALAGTLGTASVQAQEPTSTRATSFTSWGVQMGIDAFGNELKEFWPDIHRRLRKRKSSHLQQ